MLSQRDLFAGTTFHPAVQSAIYQDITNLRDFFPSLQPYNYTPPNGAPMILIQGPVSISFNSNDDFPLPINIQLPPQFPSAPPVVHLPGVDGMVIAPSKYLQENGIVVLQNVYPWAVPQSTLVLLVSAIADIFSGTAPFTPAPIRKIEFEIVQVEAESLVNLVNEEIHRAHEEDTMILQTTAYHQSIVEIQRESEDTIAALTAVLESIPPPEVPPVKVDEERLAEFESQAKVGALAEAQAALSRAYTGRQITFDQMMKATREIARQHFQNTLCKLLQTA
jgi:hypothetical protein